ncbi:DEAD/DEAH box helicase [Altererythrobacter sp.]|uniref:DEAD/DEAH box helicase n=1 Tax=Altererythrobacter sp. TaxID=1872480 RepID=UPI001B05F4EC|nr:DEAD/DEAH box helicase [Altererythrobacter sp.]MBO6608082.1 DEAD/DEAH box helicase [Altererythrobacter sp.]MBO6641662.1 DEAD/DEAH box helicase [Altererythrobacter sp.]MBO6707639.1 DEAD/DEAH box helicase [Altererythrobacter sp.]MBO6946229.1 DEAD/DEAH box helicase [Altererythrobacter sp.]
MSFADLGLSPELLKAVESAGYTKPTDIQAEAIPAVLMMKDLIGIAQTGTGKTASFVLPMIDVMAAGRRRALMPRSLILEPTRELAAQVAENFEKYGKNHDLTMALLIGGVQMGDQLKALDEGVDVLIATPGRLMDLFERGKILLNGCELLVIDEADRMLDMGFIPDIEFICSKLPDTRQTMLFSATMPPPIEKLAKKFLNNPKRIEVSRAASTNKDITAFKIPVETRQKRETLRWLLRHDLVETAIIFANKKTTVRELNKSLQRHGFPSGEIHGDMDQNSRLRELERFKSGDVNILVASDVAARGLDIKGVSHVFNFDTPWHPDDYVHRIGRTGRAGAKGRAFTFVAKEDAEAIANVEKLTGSKIAVFGKKDVRVELAEPEEKSGKSRDENKSRNARKTADQQSEEAPKKPRRERKPKTEKKAERKTSSSRHNEENEPITAGEWNGPKPGFLDFGVS